MIQTSRSKEIGAVERLLVAIGISPWDALYLTAIGFVTIPAMSRLLGNKGTGWVLGPFLLGILFMLRFVPALIRRLLPFSSAVLGIWAQRRQVSKHYDSYQWRKLFWIGTGLASYTAVSGQFSTSGVVISTACLLSGALGMVRWRIVASRIDPTALSNGPGRNSASFSGLLTK